MNDAGFRTVPEPRSFASEAFYNQNNSLHAPRVVTIGGFDHVNAVRLGRDYPVAVQTMWKGRLSFSDLKGKKGRETVKRIRGLEALGCSLLRFAVPDREGAEALGRLAGMVTLPLAADIHFDYTLALRCLDFPVAKLRINPGNIGGREKTAAVVAEAAAKKIPIRIGVNAGSLPPVLRSRFEAGTISRSEALVQAAFEELAVFGELGFENVVVSMKASGIADTIRANRLFRQRGGVPLHVGVTEAGPVCAGTARNTAALVPLLAEGIGDTVRVSLSGSMEDEVIAGREIAAAAAELSSFPRPVRDGVTLVSCPLCGRNSFNTHDFTARWMNRLYALEKRCTVAVMGCAVNGPGEARHADLGITGAGNKVLLFRRGKIVKTIDGNDIEYVDRLFGEELEKL
jgi:(E)-4-hydroxy-3-methylbut-2-enyl-diphosphate synthase